MTPRTVLRMAALAGLTALSGCGSNGSQTNNATVSGITVAAASAMLLSGDPDGSFGEAFIGSDGNGVMLVENDDQSPAAAYYAISGNVARRVPAPDSGLQVSAVAGSSTPVKVQPVNLSTLAGSYSALNRDNTVSKFVVDANGAITAGASACAVSGNIQGSSTIVGALPLAVTLTGCGKADGSYQGYVLKAAEYAPAAFRLVGDNGVSFIDMLAFQ